MHVFLERFNCNGNTRINSRNNERYEYFMQENGIQAQPVVIIDYETARIIQNDFHVMSVHFNNDTKYGLVGAVFKDTNMLRKVLEKLNSQEIKIKI